MKKYGNISNPHTPVWGDAEKTSVVLKVTIDNFDGEHYFSATSYDSCSYGVELFDDAVAGVFGEIQDYVPPSTEQIAAVARERRDALIAVTDWTQNADIPQAAKDKWAPYRQALRDVPQQAGFPNNIVWPTPPQ